METEGFSIMADPFGAVGSIDVDSHDDAAGSDGSLIVLVAHVSGVPRPKGSMKVVSVRGGKYTLQEDNVRSKPWRQQIVSAVTKIVSEPETGPVEVDLTFLFPRPTHDSGHPVEASGARATGDIDKLTRNVLDALQDAKAYKNDSQVIRLVAEKAYAIDDVDTPGVHIVMRRVVD